MKFLNNLTDIQKKFIKYIVIAVGVIILLFIVLGIAKLFRGNKLSFDKIESKMVSAATKYYEDNPHLLPDSDVSSTDLQVSTLVDKGYMKELAEYTEKGVDCSGKIVVLKNGSHYTFVPKLNCGGEHTTTDLVKKITAKSNIVDSGDGLYQTNNEYVYRGEKLNNYVSFAGKVWRILKITSNNEIRLIQNDTFDSVDWDNRYNTDEKTNSGINNFLVSRIKDDLEEIYNGETFSASDKAKIIPQKLCIGSRQEKDTSKDGSTECKTQTEDYYPLGLMQVNEFLVASIDSGCTDIYKRQCTNYNYLANLEKRFWTITADSDSTSKVYYVDYMPNSSRASTYANIRLVINVSGDVNYTKGNGTLENPYVID